MKTWVRVNEDGRRIGESHPQAVLSDVEVDALLAERDKLDRGDVWASDYQTLLGRVERSAA